jgi:hypothetical protein
MRHSDFDNLASETANDIDEIRIYPIDLWLRSSFQAAWWIKKIERGEAAASF